MTAGTLAALKNSLADPAHGWAANVKSETTRRADINAGATATDVTVTLTAAGLLDANNRPLVIAYAGQLINGVLSSGRVYYGAQLDVLDQDLHDTIVALGDAAVATADADLAARLAPGA